MKPASVPQSTPRIKSRKEKPIHFRKSGVCSTKTARILSKVGKKITGSRANFAVMRFKSETKSKML